MRNLGFCKWSVGMLSGSSNNYQRRHTQLRSNQANFKCLRTLKKFEIVVLKQKRRRSTISKDHIGFMPGLETMDRYGVHEKYDGKVSRNSVFYMLSVFILLTWKN